MKKIILVLLFVIQLLPGRQQKGQVTLCAGAALYAQCAPPDAGGPAGSCGGGSFWSWLGTAFTNIGNFFGSIGNAIGNFFNNAPGGSNPGEGMTEENNDWSWTDNGWLPTDGNNPGGPYDPWADSYWQQLGFSSDEWNILNNWQYYYDIYLQGGSPPPPPPGRYYIRVNGSDTINPAATPDTAKYYENDTLYFARSNSQAWLVVQRENSTVNTTALAWKRNDTAKCTVTTECSYDISRTGTIALKIDSANTAMRTKNTIIVYKPPTIVFQRGSNYDGEYGFDDSAQKHTHIRFDSVYRKGYEVRTINDDTAYVVPWMSLLDGQLATIKIDKKFMASAAKDDPNFTVRFVASTNNIWLNGGHEVKVNYTGLTNMNTLTIIAKEWATNADSLKTTGSIYAITNAGDTIGKLRLSCVKPQNKKLVLVFVKHDNTGYRNDEIRLTRKDRILNQLNEHSHNQLFRQWVIDSTFSDTLDISAEYSQNNAVVDSSSMVLDAVRVFYEQHKNVSLDSLNEGYRLLSNPNKVYFLFILNKEYPFFDANGNVNGYLRGRTVPGGDHGAVFLQTNGKTIVHELGHILRLWHTFPDPNAPGSRYRIPINRTVNYMDYQTDANFADKRNMFYAAQWWDIH